MNSSVKGDGSEVATDAAELSVLISRIEQCEMELHASRGYIKALEYGVHALIARHPNPAALADLWAHVLPEVADQQAEMQDRPLLYHVAFQQALAVMTEQITGARERDAD